MDAGGADDGLVHQLADQGIQAGGLIGGERMEGHGQIGFAVERHAGTLLKEPHGAPQVARVHLCQSVEHRGDALPVPEHVCRLPLQPIVEIGDGTLHGGFVHAKGGRLSFAQTQDHIGGQDGRTLVATPPAPSSIQILQRVEPLQGHPHLLGQPGGQLSIVDAQAKQRPIGDHVGQEAAHGLLDAFVGVGFHVLETFPHACGERGLQLDGELAHGGIDLLGQAHQLDDPILDLSRGAHRLGGAGMVHRQMQLHRVRVAWRGSRE